MNEVQKLQLDILCKLDEVCRRNHLIYYLAYGTCIGAVRDRGFIPWDHDIDVLMPIEDARKLESLQDEFGPQYFVSSYRTDPDFQSISMRIVDKEHETDIKKQGVVIERANLSIDVYPYYYCPKTKIGLTRNVLRSHVYKVLVGGIPQNHGNLSKLLAKIILSFFPKRNRQRDIRKYEELLNYRGESNEIADYFGLDIRFLKAITYKKEWFSEPSEMEFENHLFFGPTDVDQYLTKRYGDYMTPPPPERRMDEVEHILV